MRSIIKLNRIPNVEAGNSCSLKLPLGQTYENVHLTYSGVTPAQIKNVRIELNGRLLTEYKTMQELLDHNKRMKRHMAEGTATFHFVEPELKGVKTTDLIQQRMFSLGTVGLSSAEIKFDIDAEVANPVIEAKAEKSLGTAPGWLAHRRSTMVNLNNGITEIDNLPKPVGYRIAAIHIKAVGVESVEYYIDGTRWRDGLNKVDNNYVLRQNNREPLDNTYTLDFMLQGDVYQSVALTDKIQDMRLKIESTVQGQAQIIVEYMGIWSPLGF